MPRVQIERISRQLLGFPPIVFHQRSAPARPGHWPEHGAGQGIVFVQLIRLPQQFDAFGRLLLGAQFLALGHQTLGFGLSLYAVLRKLFELV